jgi:hypothetical protein
MAPPRRRPECECRRSRPRTPAFRSTRQPASSSRPAAGRDLRIALCALRDRDAIQLRIGGRRGDRPAAADRGRQRQRQGSSKTANTPLAGVLTNDWLDSARATLANVRLSQISLTPANNMISLDLADGSVDILGKTSSGVYSLVYEICEIAMPTNCARGTVKIDLSGK